MPPRYVFAILEREPYGDQEFGGEEPGCGAGMRDIDIVLGEKGRKPSGKVRKISPIKPTFMCSVWFFAQFLLASNG